jgi:hypothetical protein
MWPIFTALMIAFGVGVWKSAGGNRALRVTGALLSAHGATFPLWLLAPMTSREEMRVGAMPANDLGHIVLTVMAILLILGEIGFGAAAFGKRFRLYSLVTTVAIVAFGALDGSVRTHLVRRMAVVAVGAGNRPPANPRTKTKRTRRVALQV